MDTLPSNIATLFHGRELSANALLNSIKNVPVFDASLLSAMVLSLYDHALTIGDEVEHVWKNQQNLTTIGFLVARYFTLIARSVDVFLYLYPRWSASKYCNTIMKVQLPGIFTLVTLIIVHLIMILRVYALYGGNTTILFVLVFILVLEFVMLGLPLYLLGRTSNGGILINMDGLSCVRVRSPSTPLLSVYWVAPLLQDTILFVLTLWRSRQYIKSTRGTPSILVKVLLRDGIIYYLCIGTLHAINLVLFVLAPHELKPMAVGFSQSLSTILLSRLVFNLRKSSYRSHARENYGRTHSEVNTSRSDMPNLTSLAAIVEFFDIGSRGHNEGSSRDIQLQPSLHRLCVNS